MRRITRRLWIVVLVCTLAACATETPRSADTKPPMANDTGVGSDSSSSTQASSASATSPEAGATADAAPSANNPATVDAPPITAQPSAPTTATPAVPVPETKPAVAAAPAPAPAVPKRVTPPIAPISVAAPTTASAEGILSGRLKLVPARGVTLLPDDISETVVYFVPRNARPSVVPARFEVATRNKRFEPSSLVVPVGSTVVFPNRDVVLHNAFSVSAPAAFDLGIYGAGESRETTFKQPGLVLVHCNVHHSMQSVVLVVPTPFLTRLDSDGRFKLEGLPSGRGDLFLWHPRASLQSRIVDVPSAKGFEGELSINKPRVDPHVRKDGSSYRGAPDAG